MRPLFKVPLKFWYFDISPTSNKVNQKQKKRRLPCDQSLPVHLHARHAHLYKGYGMLVILYYLHVSKNNHLLYHAVFDDQPYWGKKSP